MQELSRGSFPCHHRSFDVMILSRNDIGKRSSALSKRFHAFSEAGACSRLERRVEDREVRLS